MPKEKLCFDEKNLDLCTLFVRNIPATTTKNQLEEYFSNFGPLRRCFIVAKKAQIATESVIGFVNFATKEDAAKAIEESRKGKLNGSKIKAEYALKKFLTKQLNGQDPKKHHFSSSDGDDTNLSIKQTKIDLASIEKSAIAKVESILGENNENSSSPVTMGSDLKCESSSNVNSKASKGKKSAEKQNESFKKRKNSNEQMDNNGTEDSNSKKFKKHTSKIVKSATANIKKFRLIVRNLPFAFDEKLLKDTFESFGNLIECLVPKNSLEKSRGFGILQFDSEDAAKKCMQEMNGKKFKGRPVAIDWCLGKDVYEKMQQNEEAESSDSEYADCIEDFNSTPGSDDVSNEEFKDVCANDSFFTPSDYELENNEDTDLGSCNDHSDTEIIDREKNVSKQKITNKDNFQPKKQNSLCPFTVFVRNVSFDATEDDLKDTFVQFGPISYVKIVIDTATGISKGTAFINFKSKDSFDKCLEKASEVNASDSTLVIDESRGIQVLGRTVHVMPAVNRETAHERESSKYTENQQNDKRNIHLLSEGYITANSPLALSNNFTEKELDLRRQLYLERKSKLKNLNYFISPTRISLRNLTLTLDEKQLRQIFISAGCRPSSIKQVKVVRSKDRKDQNGQFRSLGYGFVELSRHEKSLEMVRILNEKASEFFGKNRKPIIEFAIENKAILSKRQKRIESQAKPSSESNQTISNTVPKNVKIEKSKFNRKNRDGDRKNKTSVKKNKGGVKKNKAGNKKNKTGDKMKGKFQNKVKRNNMAQ